MQPIWNVYQSFFFSYKKSLWQVQFDFGLNSKIPKGPYYRAWTIVNTIQYTNIHTHTHAHAHTPWRIKLPFKQTGAITFFHWDTNPVLAHVLIYSVEKTHVLVVTVKLIWCLFLNILSFNFVPISKNLLGSQDSEEAM